MAFACVTSTTMETMERTELLRDLRTGEYDVLVGINLLREGIDLPEVSLVAILDADKEGFLRNETSLIQTIGRAARNASGKVIMYADNITRSMRAAIDETERRRRIQIAYNKEHGITPQTIKKGVHELLSIGSPPETERKKHKPAAKLSAREREERIEQLMREMKAAARRLDFERAAYLRDQIKELRTTK